MKTRYIFLLAAMALLAGCAKELDAPMAPEQVKTVVQIGLSSDSAVPVIDTKTYMGEKDAQNHRKVYWSNGDQISINRVASHALTGIADNAESATFEFDQALSKPYSIIYPASIVSGQWVELPHEQTYKDGGFADGMLPMCGYSETGTGIVMYPMCAILKVSVLQAAVDADTDDIVAVRFRGGANEKVSGLYSVSYDSHRLSAETGSGAELEVKVVKKQATSTSAAVDYFIVVPARLYDHGFEVIVQDAKGHIMTKTKAASAFLDPGHLYTMPAFEFVPTATELGIAISSAADLVQFATDFNSGVYAGKADLVATLTQDITFDAESSAAFNTTGGIGTKKGEFSTTEDNYFFGVLNGAGHTISGLAATVPLVAYTDGAGVVENLTLDNTCSLTIGEGGVRAIHAPLVGRHKGTLKNCTSNANVVINNLAEVGTAEQHYGALVARNYGGIIDHCNAGGNITAAQSGVTITTNAAYFGGVAGTMGNSGSVSYCNYTGNITISDGTDFGGITANKVYFYVGGIVGYDEEGTISHCDAATSEAPKAIVARGKLVPALGGIVGWSKVTANSGISDCNNYMTFEFKSDGTRANTTPCRVGGIAARSAAKISNCQNYGSIATTSNSTSIYLGGIAADAIDVEYCTNNAGGTIARTSQTTADQANRYIYMGGIVGGNNAASVIDHCINKAAIISHKPGTATNTTVDMGGILGWGQYKATITNCENQGNVTAQETTNNTVSARITVGGILGYGAVAGTSVKNSDNSAVVYCQYNGSAATNKRPSYTGGIVGLMGATGGVADLEIDHCDNTGQVWSRNYNNTATSLTQSAFVGGVVGAIVGASDSKASLNNCTATSTVAITAYRGIAGGIAGYAGNAELTDNSASQKVDANANGEGNGGIVGWSVASSLSGCTYSGTVSAAKLVAGLVYLFDADSSISGCKVDGATITKGSGASAVLVNNAAAGSIISNCGVKGTIDGVAIDLSSTMVATDGGAVISGTYLLD